MPVSTFAIIQLSHEKATEVAQGSVLHVKFDFVVPYGADSVSKLLSNLFNSANLRYTF